MYILKIKLTKYFKEIDKNNNVITTNNALETMLFDNEEIAIKFKNVLLNDYKIKFNIIELD